MNEKNRTLGRFLLALTLIVITSPCARSQTTELKAQEWKPPRHVNSPDGRFSVEIRDTKPDQKSNDELLIIRDRDKELARQMTFGYLLDVFWDDTGKYVAVNNRRANAGDYLWVFSLSNGKCIKEPDSPQLTPLSKLAFDAFQRLDRRATDDKLEKVWVKAKGWWGSGKLLMRFAARYGYTVGKFPAHFVYDAQAKISGSKLIFIPGEARQVQSLSD